MVFCHFWCLFEIFFIWKTAMISLKKTTGRRFRALLNVFKILIHDIYQKIALKRRKI